MKPEATDGPRVAVLAAVFDEALVGPMILAALDEMVRTGLQLAGEVYRVAGSFELPLAAQALLERADVDAVVVLGSLEKGETLHGEVIGHAVFGALTGLQLRLRKPAGLGVVGPGATREQAEARKEASARAAVRAVKASLACLERIAAG